MRSTTLAALALSVATLAGSSAAQDFQFTVVQASSNYTWSGTTSLGPLVGNPSNAFQLQGTVELDLDSGGNPVGSGQWVSSDTLVVPDLSGKIPNPIPLLPPLATIDVAGMRFSITSSPFAVSGVGAFSTTSVLTVTAGILTVTPLVGSQTVTDLTGTLGPPSATTGTITMSSGTMTFVSPMSTNFMFTDPTSGISATINLVGTMTATYACLAPANYCPVTPNSAGPGAVISTTGSTSMTANSFGLVASGCPANKPGLFFVGPQQALIPLGDGTRCITGPLKRFGVIFSSGAGVYSMGVDFNTLPGGLVISPGESVNFQCWYRDVAAGLSGFNLSDGSNVVFCP
jgi:hypothetical protein